MHIEGIRLCKLMENSTIRCQSHAMLVFIPTIMPCKHAVILNIQQHHAAKSFAYTFFFIIIYYPNITLKGLVDLLFMNASSNWTFVPFSGMMS